VNSFEERLSAALTDAQAWAPDADPDGGRAVFHEFVRGRRRRNRITMATRLTVVTLLAGAGATAFAVRMGEPPETGNPPAVTPHNQPGQHNVSQDDGRGGRSCINRVAGGCQFIG
jgi:hypothetical protein